MWGSAAIPLEQQLGGALKIIGRFQFAMGLVAPNMDRLADSLIAHHRDRSFYPEGVSAVIPRNVAELAYACSEVSDYRDDELLPVMRETLEELHAYQQPDGGFGQRRNGTEAVYWNDATLAVPETDVPRGDIHGTQTGLYWDRKMCEWFCWKEAPWPQPAHWREQLTARGDTYTLSVDEGGEVIVSRRE